jgi:hypothetical protein
MKTDIAITNDELRKLAGEIVETRGPMPDHLRIWVGCWLIDPFAGDPYRELLACLAAMMTGRLAESNTAETAWIAATVILARELGMERAFVSDF